MRIFQADLDFYSILFLTNFIFINLICLENGNVPIEGFFLYIFGLYQFFIMVLVGYTYNGFIYDLTILMLFTGLTGAGWHLPTGRNTLRNLHLRTYIFLSPSVSLLRRLLGGITRLYPAFPGLPLPPDWRALDFTTNLTHLAQDLNPLRQE